MILDKFLQKIISQLSSLESATENFRDQNIQPSVQDCDQLETHLHELLASLAIYKYHKQNNELSPSFNIHAKVSEKQGEVEQVPIQAKPEKQKQPIPQPQKEQPAVDPKKAKAAQTLVIGINDKFRFINELFSQNGSEYNIVFEQLSTLTTWNETDIYLSSLKNVYGWKDNNEVVKYFYSLVKRRFE